MERSLPLHWQHFQKGSKAVATHLGIPLAGDDGRGGRSRSGGPRPHRARRDERSWNSAGTGGRVGRGSIRRRPMTPPSTGIPSKSPMGLDSSPASGLLGDTTYGFAQMAGQFTVNNPGNGIPEAGVVSPDSGQAIARDGHGRVVGRRRRQWGSPHDRHRCQPRQRQDVGAPGGPAEHRQLFLEYSGQSQLSRVQGPGAGKRCGGDRDLGLRAVLPVQLASFAPEVPGPACFRER